MIVVAPSYTGLVYALEFFILSEITVISDNLNIQKFCRKTKLTCLPLTVIGNKNKDQQKSKFNPTLISYKNEEILFCFHRYAINYLQFLYKIKSSNNIYFCNLDPVFKHVRIPRNKLDLGRIKELFLKRKETKLPLSLYKINDETYYFGISPKQLKRDFNVHRTQSECKYFDENKKQILSNYKLQKIDVLYIDQGNSVFKIPDKIIDIIRTNVKGNIAIKSHPTFPISNSKWNEIGTILPEEIPSELLIEDSTLVIGTASTSMKNAPKCISIAYLVAWNDKSDFKRYSILLSLDQFHLPKNTLELESLLKNFNPLII